MKPNVNDSSEPNDLGLAAHAIYSSTEKCNVYILSNCSELINGETDNYNTRE